MKNVAEVNETFICLSLLGKSGGIFKSQLMQVLLSHRRQLG